MNWLINKLASEKTYFPIFMGALSIYAALACITMSYVLNNFPARIGQTAFLFFGGSVVLGYLGRLTHNWASNKVNQDNDLQ